MRERIDSPVFSTVSRVQHLTDFAAAEDVIGQVGAYRQTKNGRLQRYAQVRLIPVGAVVTTDEKSASVSIEIVACRQIEGVGIARSVGQHAAIGADRSQTGSL